ncbi:hypothetical protein C6497_09070 [Candidatus Poribacteria bacterium]|nr:MAG: hypothetical protein C6497_09070 [Candidatus Poribacteria bacterium]
MRVTNLFLCITIITFLLTVSSLIGCSEGNRVIQFPNTDLPESVTVMIQDVPEGTAFNLDISTDYSLYKDSLGSTVIDYNYNEKYTITKNFSKTFPLSDEEPTIALSLICTNVNPTSDDHINSIRLIIRFNGDGNFNYGNHNDIHPIEVGRNIYIISTFSRYEGTSKSVKSFLDDNTPPPIRSTD